MRTQDNLNALAEALLHNCGDFFAACKTCLLSPAFVRKWMKEDDKVREEIEAATEVGAMRLESTAIQRAVNGVDEDVFYQGAVVGQVTKYSDSLLQTLLKKRLKHIYGDEAATTNVSFNLQQAINIMPRANTYEEWLNYTRQAKGKLLEGEAVSIPVHALPAPQQDPAMADIL